MCTYRNIQRKQNKRYYFVFYETKSKIFYNQRLFKYSSLKYCMQPLLVPVFLIYCIFIENKSKEGLLKLNVGLKSRN